MCNYLQGKTTYIAVDRSSNMIITNDHRLVIQMQITKCEQNTKGKSLIFLGDVCTRKNSTGENNKDSHTFILGWAHFCRTRPLKRQGFVHFNYPLHYYYAFTPGWL